MESINFQTARAQARGRWLHILVSAGVSQEYLTGKHGPCPACGGSDRFKYDDIDGHGTFYCSGCGGPGDGFRLLQLVNSCTAAESLRAVAELLNIGHAVAVPLPRNAPAIATRGNDPPEVNEEAKKANILLWSAAVAITSGDPADIYLRKTRRIELETYPHCLRYHPKVGYYNEDRELVGHFPAMLALVIDAAGQMVAVHKTYLTREGAKAAVPEAKKLSRSIFPGATQGAAIRLFEAGDVLAVAEGIETALAAHLMADEYLPVWSTVTANGLESLVVPPCVKRLVICGDNDASNRGREAAQKLAARQTERGVTCQIIIPETPGSDWADVLIEVSNNVI